MLVDFSGLMFGDGICGSANFAAGLVASVPVPESATFAISCTVPSNGGTAGVVGFVGQAPSSLENLLP